MARGLRHTFASMGCPCEIQLESDDADALRAAAIAAEAEVHRLDRKYSHYRDDSLVAELGRCADRGEVCTVDDETAALLDLAASLHLQSDGLFDITAAPLTRLWDVRDGRLPSAEAIDAAQRRVGWSQVVWCRPRLHFTTPGLRLDFGGLVKEYAADRAAQCCREAGVYHGVVDLGGDLAVVGPHADGRPWLTGIKAPRAAGAVAEIALHKGALATSGDYERCIVIDGSRYSHIIDPRSGLPVESFASVSVVADTCLVAGTATTLAMLFGVERGRGWLRELGLPHLWIDGDGNMGGDFAATPQREVS